MKVHVEDRIDAYFEGALSVPADRDALFGHLDRCPDCRRHFDAVAEANRLLFEADILPDAELDVLRDGVLAVRAEAAVLERPLLGRRMWLNWLTPAAMAAILLFLAFPTSTFTTKGGGVEPVKPTIEVLCFDNEAQIVAHLETSGTCPVPGFIKIIYASPATVPHLTVAARTKTEVLFISALTEPEPRSVVPEHTKLEAGDVIEIVVFEGETPPDAESIRNATPVIVVSGEVR